jgi:hypothetical protein
MMIFQLVAHQPQALGTIVRHTPHWVWGLLVALLALGASQLAPRRASALRVCLMPVSLTIFAIYGLVAAFGGSGQEAGAAGAWLGATMGSLALTLWRFPAPMAGTRFDPATRTFALPGSVLPLLMIVGIFLTKYIVGIELALQPSQALSPPFALGVASLYGAFNGLFVARLVRLWRLSRAQPIRSETPQTHSY